MYHLKCSDIGLISIPYMLIYKVHSIIGNTNIVLGQP